MRQRLPRRNCKTCGKECNEPCQIYCTKQCQKDYQWSVRKLEIERTGVLQIAEYGTTARRYLLEKFGNKCQICSRDEWDGKPMPLVLDHVNGNSDDWSMSNCRLICPNCDTFTPFYKSKNIGNGRFRRRQRYAEGKSY